MGIVNKVQKSYMLSYMDSTTDLNYFPLIAIAIGEGINNKIRRIQSRKPSFLSLVLDFFFLKNPPSNIALTVLRCKP